MRELRTFPGGIDYLLGEWAILQARLIRGKNLLGTQRQRCFALLQRHRFDVLRSDPVATRVLVAQIGVLCGPEAPFEDVASFLGGGRPPQGMDQAEYTIRVKEIAGSLLPRPESFAELSAIVAEAVAELKTLRKVVQESADRDLAFDAVTAQMSSTPEGTRLANLVDKHEKGFMAALRRVQDPPAASEEATGPVGKARNPKSEIRDKLEIRMKPAQNRRGRPLR